jgi:hypothetical protein
MQTFNESTKLHIFALCNDTVLYEPPDFYHQPYIEAGETKNVIRKAPSGRIFV